jgi:tetratricopeptide (TPR) repeat protein
VYHTGDLTTAVRLHEEMLAAQKSVWGPRHKDTLDSMYGLALGYQRVGRFPAMATLLEEATAAMDETYGDSHPKTLRARDDLAEAYRSCGRLPEAVVLREQTLRKLEVARGPDHPETMHCVIGLGNCLREAGRTAEALALQESNLDRRRQKHGPSHPETVRALYGLAAACEDDGQVERAVDLYRQVVSLTREQFGDKHRETADAQESFGQALLRLHRPGEAATALKEALVYWEGRFPDGWRTAQLRSQLGEMEIVQRHFAEAEALLLPAWEALDRHTRETGGDGPAIGRRATARRLVGLYVDWKKPAEAAVWRERLRAITPK